MQQPDTEMQSMKDGANKVSDDPLNLVRKSSGKSSTRFRQERAEPMTSFMGIMDFVQPLGDDDIFAEMGIQRAAPVKIPVEPKVKQSTQVKPVSPKKPALQPVAPVLTTQPEQPKSNDEAPKSQSTVSPQKKSPVKESLKEASPEKKVEVQTLQNVPQEEAQKE